MKEVETEERKVLGLIRAAPWSANEDINVNFLDVNTIISEVEKQRN